jgi:hypothetical protein
MKMTKTDTSLTTTSKPIVSTASITEAICNARRCMAVSLPSVALAAAYRIWRISMSEYATKQMRDWFTDQARQYNRANTAAHASGAATTAVLSGLTDGNVPYRTAVRFIFNLKEVTDALQIARYASILRRLHAAFHQRQIKSLRFVVEAVLDLGLCEIDDCGPLSSCLHRESKEIVLERRDKRDARPGPAASLYYFSYPTQNHKNIQLSLRSAPGTGLGVSASHSTL